jgi:hypothetical protein
MKKLISLIAVCSFLLVGTLAQAATPFYTSSMKIESVFVSGPTNYHFRGVSTPLASYGCKANFAYINEADPGSKTYISTLLAAFLSGKLVSFNLLVDSNGYCHINEIIVNN